MTSPIGHEALKHNADLEPFAAFIGQWTTTGTHPLVPGTTFHGRTSFDWHEGGAFVVMRSEIDEPEIPSGVAILGIDGSSKAITILYFDERGVSRHYEAAIEGNTLRWWRNSPDISQRNTITIAPDGKTMRSKGEYAKGDEEWGPDLQLTFTRL